VRYSFFKIGCAQIVAYREAEGEILVAWRAAGSKDTDMGCFRKLEGERC